MNEFPYKEKGLHSVWSALKLPSSSKTLPPWLHSDWSRAGHQIQAGQSETFPENVQLEPKDPLLSSNEAEKNARSESVNDHRPHEAGSTGGFPGSGVPGPALSPVPMAINSSFGSLRYFISPFPLKLV